MIHATSLDYLPHIRQVHPLGYPPKDEFEQTYSTIKHFEEKNLITLTRISPDDPRDRLEEEELEHDLFNGMVDKDLRLEFFLKIILNLK